MPLFAEIIIFGVKVMMAGCAFLALLQGRPPEVTALLVMFALVVCVESGFGVFTRYSELAAAKKSQKNS